MMKARVLEISIGSLMAVGILVFAADAEPAQDAPAGNTAQNSTLPNLKYTPAKARENSQAANPGAASGDAAEPADVVERRRVEVLKSNRGDAPAAGTADQTQPTTPCPSSSAVVTGVGSQAQAGGAAAGAGHAAEGRADAPSTRAGAACTPQASAQAVPPPVTGGKSISEKGVSSTKSR